MSSNPPKKSDGSRSGNNPQSPGRSGSEGDKSRGQGSQNPRPGASPSIPGKQGSDRGRSGSDTEPRIDRNREDREAREGGSRERR